MYIRWLGAFGKKCSLLESIDFEMTRHTPIACERIRSKQDSAITHAHVGLLVVPQEVYKNFNGDCWSEYETVSKNKHFWYGKEGQETPEKGKTVLKQNRNPRNSGGSHLESWANPVYDGIVIDAQVSDCVFENLVTASKKYNLPVYRLKKGKLSLISR